MPLSFKDIIKILESESPRPSRHTAAGEILFEYQGLSQNDVRSIIAVLRPITSDVIVVDHDQFKYKRRSDEGFGPGWKEWITPAWVVPAAIALLFGKGLLDGFLKEFGADGAKALKRIISDFYHKQNQKRSNYISLFPDGIPQTKYVRTPIVELTIHLGIGAVYAKFSFPLGLTKTETSKALKRIPAIIPKAKELAETLPRKAGRIVFEFRNEDWVLVKTPSTTKPRKLKKK